MKHELEDPRAVRAWCLYDWANSAFATTVMAAMYPPFFRGLAIAAGIGESRATAYWGSTSALALAIVALASPVLGAAADYRGTRKRFLGVFIALFLVFRALHALLILPVLKALLPGENSVRHVFKKLRDQWTLAILEDPRLGGIDDVHIRVVGYVATIQQIVPCAVFYVIIELHYFI